MRKAPDSDGFVTVGTVRLQAGELLGVTLSSEQSGGFVHADAVQILPKP
jgi:hypothetical protein